MIREGFFKYISQPIKNFYNYVTGKASEEIDTDVNLEVNASFVVEQQDITPATNEHDVL